MKPMSKKSTAITLVIVAVFLILAFTVDRRFLGAAMLTVILIISFNTD